MNGKMRPVLSILYVLALVAALAACGQSSSPTAPTAAPGALTPLPPPAVSGDKSLEEVLAQRHSVRKFGDQPLTMAEIGQLLWAAQGITHGNSGRTAPSAGALYPLELYVATAEGVFHYDPANHRLLLTGQGDPRANLYRAAGRQDSVRQAPAVFIVAAVYERTATKYGPERTPRYVHLEAGHAAQNLLLQAVALGLGAVSVGAFDDGEVQQALGLPTDHEPLYLIPVGHPAGSTG